MVTYMTKPIITCANCNASGLCTDADEHREKRGYSKIGVNSDECKECKEKYADEFQAMGETHSMKTEKGQARAIKGVESIFK